MYELILAIALFFPGDGSLTVLRMDSAFFESRAACRAASKPATDRIIAQAGTLVRIREMPARGKIESRCVFKEVQMAARRGGSPA